MGYTYSYRIRTTYSCRNCGRVLAVDPWKRLGSPRRKCPFCQQPVVYNWFEEWDDCPARARASTA